jgi:hypothetical protein
MKELEQHRREVGTDGWQLVGHGLDVGADQQRENDPVQEGHGKQAQAAVKLETLLFSPHILAQRKRNARRFRAVSAQTRRFRE